MQAEHSRESGQRQGADRGRDRAGDRLAQDRRQAAGPSHINPATDLRSSWISLLSRYHWDLFGSLTFREDTHPESAHKRFRLFISMINRKLYGPRWAKHGVGVSWALAMERQRRGVLHFHCLLADPELTNLLKGSWFKLDGRWANELNEMWNKLAGFARIEPIEVAELVQRYVSKYVIKDGQIDLGGPMMQRRLEQAPTVTEGTTGQRGDGGLGDHSVSVPVSPGPGRSRGDRVEVRETSTRSPHLFLTGGTAAGLVRPVILERVTTSEERAQLLARFTTSTRRETAELLKAVRVRVLAFKAGYREPVA